MTWDHSAVRLILDAVQILLLTILARWVIVIFRSGRATGILLTLMLLGLIYGLATLLEMWAITTVFHVLAPVLGVALVVVFQPEIRRALESSGNLGNLLAPGARRAAPEVRQTIDMLVRVAEELAASHRGALIVLEQHSNLDNIIETGEVLDARLARPLLLAIFDQHSPLHDGAVVIRGQRLVAAHCFLPLSDDPNLPSHYGTRHRAAVGLSEVSDAIILVVSEETGRLSLVYQAVVAENLAPVALKYQLQALLMPGAHLASPVGEREPDDPAARVVPEGVE